MDKDLKRAAKRLAQIFVELDATKVDSAKVGYVMNQWGQFWRVDLVEEWLALNSRFLSLDNFDERTAASYGHAMFLVTINRIDEAEDQFRKLSVEKPGAPALRGLAIVAARRGSMDQALTLAQNSREASHGASFGISDAEIRREEIIGRLFTK